MNADHAPRILAQRQRDAENAAMADLEKAAAPLLWAVYLVAVIAMLGLTVSHVERVAELDATNELMVQCFNGRAVALGDAVLRCDVTDYKLVGGGRS